MAKTSAAQKKANDRVYYPGDSVIVTKRVYEAVPLGSLGVVRRITNVAGPLTMYCIEFPGGNEWHFWDVELAPAIGVTNG